MKNLNGLIENIIEYSYSNTNNSIINIAYGIDNNYVRCVATSIVSFKINNFNKNFVFHILGYDISEDNKVHLKFLAKKYKIDIILYELNKVSFEDLPVTDYWSKAMYFRFIIPQILKKEEKVFYFDADIICLKDASELFNINLNEKIVGAVLDIKRVARKKEKIFNLKENSYFNSGMMVIDIKKWNKYDILAKVIKILKCNIKFTHPDQDALNIVLKNNVKYLKTCFNCIDIYSINNKNIVILHFANHPKPWNKYWFLNVIHTSFTANLYSFYEKQAFFKDYKLDSFKNYKQLLKWWIKFMIFKIIKRV